MLVKVRRVFEYVHLVFGFMRKTYRLTRREIAIQICEK